MKTMLDTLFHAYELRVKDPSELGLKGPCSVKKAMSPEQPFINVIIRFNRRISGGINSTF